MLAAITVILMMGSTMAWFQDSKVVINTYTFGNLAVDIMKEQDEGYVSAQAQAVKFQKCYDPGGTYAEGEYLFEPGATFRLEDIYIKNSGDVPLKYRLEVDRSGATGDTELLDSMDIKMEMDGKPYDGETPQSLEAAALSEPIQIYLHMKESAGNEYQNLSVSGVVVKVIAVQDEGIPDDKLDEAFEQAGASSASGS